MSHVRPILLLEINEVPWRVIDWARQEGAYPNIDRFFCRAQTYTTQSVDRGELSPWITWPSFHRGVNNEEHHIANLGQDVSTFRGTPIWDEYRARGLDVGVFGSMQSWPPKDPGEGGFFVPDTFAHDERCIPARVEPLQRLNLSLVRKNGFAYRDTGLLSGELFSAIPAVLNSHITPRTVARIAQQLISERLDPSRCARRAIFQTVLFWDVFKGLFDPARPPAFTTFFTNHVAGVMHRYWDHVFPEDFGKASHGPHLDTMRFALQVTDELLGEALGFIEQNPRLVVVMATSMGQSAVFREHEGITFSVTDLAALLRTYGLGARDYTPLLAMVPQVSADVHDAATRRSLRERLEAATTLSGARMFLVDEVGKSLTISVCTPRRVDHEKGGFYREGHGTAFVPWGEAGITCHELPPGTAYHIPEGIMAVVGEGIHASAARTPMLATQAKAHLMRLGGLEAPARAQPQVEARA